MKSLKKIAVMSLPLVLILSACNGGENSDSSAIITSSTDIPDDTFVTSGYPPTTTSTSSIKKTGQTKSYDKNANEVTDNSLKDDGYYQKGKVPRYTRTSDMVSDELTGLVWQDDVGAKRTKKEWSKVETYCSDLTLGGYADWRVPTITELEGIVDYGTSYPAINTALFNNTGTDVYWSSTSHYDAGHKFIRHASGHEHDIQEVSNAWFVDFYDGSDSYGSKKSYFFIRCVRDEEQ